LAPGELPFESEELLTHKKGPEGEVDEEWDAGWETPVERWMRRLKALLHLGGRSKAA
jgi:hypothetical protein